MGHLAGWERSSLGPGRGKGTNRRTRRTMTLRGRLRECRFGAPFGLDSPPPTIFAVGAVLGITIGGGTCPARRRPNHLPAPHSVASWFASAARATHSTAG